MILVLDWLALALAALPAGLGAANLAALRPPRAAAADPDLLVSILIPARDEAARIGDALAAARASEGVQVEIVVMDDGSTDGTAAIVRAHAAEDPRVRLETAPPLPPGWAGKSHACQRLAEAARGTHLLFVDADVRLAPHAAATLAMHARREGLALVSGVPRQEMRSLGELLTVPMINFLIVGYLPLARMRAGTDPALGAACGQLLLVDAKAYAAVGGHASIRERIHDALMLVRRFRAMGYRTDLVAGTGLARCRMYEGFAEAWGGFLKNAHEGMARPLALPVWTLLLAGGQLLPPLLVIAALAGLGPLWLPLLALLLSLILRAAVTVRTGESLWSVPLHPLTVATALAIQWTALLRLGRGRPTAWRGRVYHAS
jgi:glycosyltransferase involved in cell wall biosynthesis